LGLVQVAQGRSAAGQTGQSESGGKSWLNVISIAMPPVHDEMPDIKK
jgi:hypothetical protein